MPRTLPSRSVILAVTLLACGARGDAEQPSGPVVTLPGSAVGAEAEVLRVQLARFMRRHPAVRVVQQRTPDAADQRHQLYVQWLNARAADPDVLQLDVIWTPEFAAAGWLLPLRRSEAELADFFPAALAANRFRGQLYALPWFVDVGMLYYRTDLLAAPPQSYAELVAAAQRAQAQGEVRHGLLWQGARYEGLVTVFVEYLAAHGGEVLDRSGRVALDSPAARRALAAMRAALTTGVVPRAALGWQEEQTRFAFQNGRALFMRNWPYAAPLLAGPGSAVAGRFAVTTLPAAAGGRAAAALGGSQLAINAHSDQPEAARALIEFLLEPAQMIERARVAGQLPPRRSLYRGHALAAALPIDAARAEHLLESAVARPATPVYAELSDILQVHVHRCLSGQEEPDHAVRAASRELEALLARVRLSPGAEPAQRGAGDG